MMQCDAVCGRVLRCVLRCVAEQLGVLRYHKVDESSVAVCCSVLQCVAIGCNKILQSQ